MYNVNYLSKLKYFDKVIILDEVSSTNDYIKLLDLNSNYLVISKFQTQGKGTNGRSFYSPKNKGMYLSFSIDNDIDNKIIVRLTAISFVLAIKKLYNIKIDIKWINDIYFNKNKLGGILIEKIHEKNKRKIIIGIGVNLYKDKYPTDLINIISLDQIINDFDINEIIVNFINLFFLYMNNTSFINDTYYNYLDKSFTYVKE